MDSGRVVGFDFGGRGVGHGPDLDAALRAYEEGIYAEATRDRGAFGLPTSVAPVSVIEEVASALPPSAFRATASLSAPPLCTCRSYRAYASDEAGSQTHL